MKRMMTVAMLLVLATFTTVARQKPTERFRVLISTDIGGTDPVEGLLQGQRPLCREPFHLLYWNAILYHHFDHRRLCAHLWRNNG